MPQYILGLSEEHDSGVTLIDLQGRILFSSNEERYTRIKFKWGWPVLSLRTLVEFLKKKRIPFPTTIAMASLYHAPERWQTSTLSAGFLVDAIENFFSYLGADRILWGTMLAEPIFRILGGLQKGKREEKIRSKISKYTKKKLSITFVDHHEAHAASAYYTSGWDDCFIITQDGQGDGIGSRVYRGQNGKMTLLHSIPLYHSPGYYYLFITELLGFKAGREGKVTGLAACGDPSKLLPSFLHELSYDPKKFTYINHGLFRTRQQERLKKIIQGYSREDVSAGIQRHLEEVMIAYISDILLHYSGGDPVKLAVAGGIFANVKLNQKIAELTGVSSLYVYPHMSDGGLPVGSALSVLSKQTHVKPYAIPHVYVGDGITKSDIRTAVLQFKDRIIATKPKHLVFKIARLLANGKVVALVHGRMEYGPRALGHRSLLSQATDKSVNDWLNKRLKRSEFMPFAPIVRVQDVPKYFIGWEKVMPSLPFMTVTVNCNTRSQKEAPAIVHVDGTARPQIVRKSVEPLLYAILTCYQKITGKHMLINTSYNIHEEPIVRTAYDAIKTFLEGHIDALVIEDTLIFLRKQ